MVSAYQTNPKMEVSMQISVMNKKAFLLKAATGLFLTFCFTSGILAAQQEQTPEEQKLHASFLKDYGKHNEVEQHRQNEEDEAQKKLIPEAIQVIKSTEEAIHYAMNGQQKEALQAVEQAQGKIKTLLANHPKESLLPVDVDVFIVESAPLALKVIKETAAAAEKAFKRKIIRMPVSCLILCAVKSILISIACLLLSILKLYERPQTC